MKLTGLPQFCSDLTVTVHFCMGITVTVKQIKINKADNISPAPVQSIRHGVFGAWTFALIAKDITDTCTPLISNHTPKCFCFIQGNLQKTCHQESKGEQTRAQSKIMGLYQWIQTATDQERNPRAQYPRAATASIKLPVRQLYKCHSKGDFSSTGIFSTHI